MSLLTHEQARAAQLPAKVEQKQVERAWPQLQVCVLCVCLSSHPPCEVFNSIGMRQPSNSPFHATNVTEVAFMGH